MNDRAHEFGSIVGCAPLDPERVAAMAARDLKQRVERIAARNWAAIPPPDAKSARVVEAIREKYRGQDNEEEKVGVAIAYYHWRRRFPQRFIPRRWHARRFEQWLPSSHPKTHVAEV